MFDEMRVKGIDDVVDEGALPVLAFFAVRTAKKILLVLASNESM